MIEQLKISASTVFLQGISLKGSFFLTNPNDHLAINFDIEPVENQKQMESDNPDTTTSIFSFLSIFPKNGFLLKNQTQRITIKAKSREDFDYRNFFESHAKLCVKYSLNNNFNMLLLKNKKISNFQAFENQKSLQNCEGVAMINIQVGTDHIRLKDQIQNQVMLGSSLGKQTVNISRIKNSQEVIVENDEDNSDVCTIINSLELSSKIKLNSLLQSPILKKQNENQKEQLKKQSCQGQIFESFRLQTARAVSFSKHQQNKSKINSQSSTSSQKQKKRYNFQIIIIAIIAAFFFSLGNNLGYIIKN